MFPEHCGLGFAQEKKPHKHRPYPVKFLCSWVSFLQISAWPMSAFPAFNCFVITILNITCPYFLGVICRRVNFTWATVTLLKLTNDWLGARCGSQATAKGDKKIRWVQESSFLPTAAWERADLFFMFYFIHNFCPLSDFIS